MSINVSDIGKYFRFISTHLNPENEIFTYCLLDAESKNVIQGHGVKFGVIVEILEDCKWQERTDYKPFTLHTTLNSTKLSGRKTKDIEGVRVFCVDFDREVSKQTLKPLIEANHVQMVVESSPGKYHFYWKIDPAISLDLWHIYQLGLNQFFGGDLQMAGVSHTIRVPGVSRITKEGQEFMPSIVYMAADMPVLGSEKIRELFPWIFNKADEAKTEQTKNKRNISKTIKNFKPGPRDFTPIISGEDRNSTLFSLIYGMTAPVNSEIDSIDIAAQEGRGFNLALEHHPKGPLGEDEVIKTVESAFERGLEAREKRKAREEKKLERILGAEVMHTNGHIEDPAILENGIDTNGTNNRFEYNFSTGDLRDSPYTDYGITERVIQRFGNHLIRTGAIVYAFDRRQLVWKSQKGCPTLIYDYLAEVCREVVKEPGFLNECRGDDGDISIAKFTRMKGRILGNTFLAQGVSIILNSPNLVTKSIQIFDNNPYLFYCANGVIDLREEASLRAPSATDYLIRRSAVEYIPDAVCPYWENFLREVFAENDNPEQMIGFIQEIFGYALTGLIDEQALFLHSGAGSNGKSRVLHALGSLVGEYSTRLQSNALTKSRGAIGKEIERIGAKIEAKRVVIIDDLDTRTQWNDGLVKCLTEKTIVSRRLYEEEKDIPNRAKFHIACNETPSIDGNSFAMFRRVSIIEYNRTFTPDAAKLGEIDTAIDRELSGILNWALRGFKRVLNAGMLTKPEEVLTRAEVYQEANTGIEDRLPEIFGPSEGEEDSHTIYDCVLHANKSFSQLGHMGVTFRAEVLGRELKRLGFGSTRKTKNKKKFTFYSVKLLYLGNRTVLDTL